MSASHEKSPTEVQLNMQHPNSAASTFWSAFGCQFVQLWPVGRWHRAFFLRKKDKQYLKFHHLVTTNQGTFIASPFFHHLSYQYSNERGWFFTRLRMIFLVNETYIPQSLTWFTWKWWVSKFGSSPFPDKKTFRWRKEMFNFPVRCKMFFILQKRIPSIFILLYPLGSMYSVSASVCLICTINVGKYTKHGSYGYGKLLRSTLAKFKACPQLHVSSETRTVFTGSVQVTQDPPNLPYMEKLCYINYQTPRALNKNIRRLPAVSLVKE